MDYFNEFKKLMHQHNPGQSFTQEEEDFLREEYIDLKEFVQSLRADPPELEKIVFSDVMVDEIFYEGKTGYVKIDEFTARKLESGETNRRGSKEFLAGAEVGRKVPGG